MGAPIRIPCEGSGYPTHASTAVVSICSMCGQPVEVTTGDAVAMPHDRDDILAMLPRGDFS